MTTAPVDAGDDRRWLEQAVELAVRSVADGGGPFGALVVGSGELVATGQNRVTRDHDPTAHAEVMAIRGAGAGRADFDLSGCVLYSSCEPCPMCLCAALWARLDRVVYAADRHDAARGGFDDLAFYDLLTRGRAHWPTRVHELRLDDAFAPFGAWLEKRDRTPY